MKTFFYYLFTLKWWRMVKLAWSTEEQMDLQKFGDIGLHLVSIKPALNVSRRKLIKSIDKLRKGVELYPLGINIFDGFNFNKSSADIVDEWFEGDLDRDYQIVVSDKVFDQLAPDDDEWFLDGNLLVKDGDVWGDFAEDEGLTLLRTTLNNAWEQYARRTGNLPTICNNCEGDLLIRWADHTCQRCGRDIDAKIPTELHKLYEDVVAYEQTNGSTLLPRAA